MRSVRINSQCYRALLLLAVPIAAFAMDSGPYEITLQADVRFVAVDSPYTSFVNGGLGLLRYDQDHDGLRLGRLFADFNGPISETIRGDLTLSTTGDTGANAIDVTEAVLEWRPYPRDILRWRTRVGAFYPPISLENRAIGWQSPYTVSTSGINTWIGEEVRVYGVEQSMSLTATPARRFDAALIVGAFMWDDPMGALIFLRGWALHDRETAVFGSLPSSFGGTSFKTMGFNHEIDGRVGYYAGAEYKYGTHVARLLHYDKRGDPSQSNDSGSAWLSRFNSFGWRYELPTHTTFIAQGLKGNTAVGAGPDGRGALIADYWSYFFLASQQYRQHRFTARYDRLYVDSTRGANLFLTDQTAIAWTFAYLWDFSRSWQVAVESLQIRGSLEQRVRA